MGIRVLRDQAGREVYRLETPDGVLGFIVAEVPVEALRNLVRKITRKLRDGERRRARKVIVGSD